MPGDEDGGDADVVVEDDDVGILAGGEGALAVVDAEDARGGVGSHTHNVGQGDAGTYHRADEDVGGGDASCEGAAVGQLADAILDNGAGVEESGGGVRVTGSCTHGVGDEGGAGGSLKLVDETQQGGRHVDAVCDDFDSDAVGEIDSLDGALMLVDAFLVNGGHGVVEVGGVGEAGIVGGTHLSVVGAGVGEGDEGILQTGVASELEGSGQLGGCTPAAYAASAAEEGLVLVGLRSGDIARVLRALHEGVDVVALEVEAKQLGSRPARETFVGNGDAGVDDIGRRHSKGGEQGGGAVPGMCQADGIKSLRCGFHEVVASGSVDMHIDAAGCDVAAVGIVLLVTLAHDGAGDVVAYLDDGAVDPGDEAIGDDACGDNDAGSRDALDGVHGRNRLSDGAFGIHAEEDGNHDGEAPEGAAAVAKEGQGNADDRGEPEHHADVDEQVQGEDADDGVAVDARKAVGTLPLGKYEQAQDEGTEEEEHGDGADEALFFADGTEDEVGGLLGNVVELGLRALEEALAEESSRADGYLRLVDIVAYALVVDVDAEGDADACLLVVLEDVVEHVVARVVVAYGAEGEDADEHVARHAFHSVDDEQVEEDEHADDDLDNADIERNEEARREVGGEGGAQRGEQDDSSATPIVCIDAQHEGGDEGYKEQDDEHACIDGHIGERLPSQADAEHEEDDGTDPHEEQGARHPLAIEHEEEGEIDEGGAGLALCHDK